jgi:hypothetical protein
LTTRGYHATQRGRSGDPAPLVEPLGEGRLCLSTTSELAKVLTAENGSEMAPRFFGVSAREAQVLVA